MKKLLALLLALLLPAVALAEAGRIDVTLTVNEENAGRLFAESGIFAGNQNEEKLCASLAKLLNGLRVSLLTQENAGRFELAVGDTVLLDLSVMLGGEDFILTSDMLNGKGLAVPLSEMQLEDDAFIRLMERTDWFGLLSGMGMAAMQSVQGVEATRTRGSFSGDAYTGGVYCTTITFDDAQIAALLNALLTDDLRTLIMQLAEYWEFDGEALLTQMLARNDEVTQANEHHYVLRLVEGEDLEPVGLSFTALRGNEQLATLSLGIENDSLHMVVGFGLDSENYWHSHKITFAQSEDDQGMKIFTVSGELKEFTSAKMNSFALASEISSEYRMKNQWQAEVRVQTGGTSWKLSSEQQMGTGTPVLGMTGQGLYVPGVRFTHIATYSMDQREIMTEKLTWAPCDPIDATGEGLELLNLLDSDGETQYELGVAWGMEIVQRLMRVIPMDMLLYLQ